MTKDLLDAGAVLPEPVSDLSVPLSARTYRSDALGDRVVVRYVEALAASLAKPGQGGGGTAVEQGGIARHAPEGARPTGTIGNQIRATVTIDAIDRATHTVTFTGPANAARTVVVRDPEAQRFLDPLKAGDRVDLVYTESLAVAVEPMSK